MSSASTNAGVSKALRHIPLSYNNADSQTSALRLVLTLFPEWEHDEGKIEFIRFTDGITNTVGYIGWGCLILLSCTGLAKFRC
jgi:ethanolamine kinase